MPTRVRGQLAFDEKAVEDVALESALEWRQTCKDALGAVRLRFEEADEAARAEIARMDLGDGTAIRVGRFRVTRQVVAARSVRFEAKATSRTRISLAEQDD